MKTKEEPRRQCPCEWCTRRAVLVTSLENLIMMKRTSGRLKDSTLEHSQDKRP
jgi:hypothetical protein